MTSDIVKVLRGKYALDYDEKTLDQFCNEAADEIEKLRAALKDMAKHIWRGDWDKLDPETRALMGEKE
jgi:hypothetical protein